jgi:8-oxo-dGTP diphosphatase
MRQTVAKLVRIAIAVVAQNAEVLIGQRPAGVPLAGYWEFPGGKILAHETPEAAAVRECREESGLEVQVVSALGTYQHCYQHGQHELHFFLCRPTALDRELAPPFRWVAASELGRYQFPEANADVLRQLPSVLARTNA